MDIKVSVIIPVFNGEKTIKRCINSVLNQTLREIEVIAVNDGSNDNTLGILKSYNDERLKIITVQNGGQGMARNKGLEIAKGEYVGFVDADDTINELMYETMYKKAALTNADMVQCAINDIKYDIIHKRPNISDEFVVITDSREYVRKYFYELKHTNEVCNKIFKMQFLKNNEVTFGDTKLIYSEDLKFNIDILERLNRVCYVSTPFYNYYISNSGHCKKSPEERVLKIFRLYEEAIENIEDNIIKRGVESTALITLLSYCVPVINSQSAKKVVMSGKVRRYMFSSLLYKKTLRHSALMLALIICPWFIKHKIILHQYSF